MPTWMWFWIAVAAVLVLLMVVAVLLDRRWGSPNIAKPRSTDEFGGLSVP